MAGGQRPDELSGGAYIACCRNSRNHGGSFGTGDPYEPGDGRALILALNGEALHALVGPSGWFPLNDEPCSHLKSCSGGGGRRSFWLILNGEVGPINEPSG